MVIANRFRFSPADLQNKDLPTRLIVTQLSTRSFNIVKCLAGYEGMINLDSAMIRSNHTNIDANIQIAEKALY